MAHSGRFLNERRLENFYFVRINQDLHVLFSDAAASDVVNNIGAKNGVASVLQPAALELYR